VGRVGFGATLFLLLPIVAGADPCRLATQEEARSARQLLDGHALVVSYCWWCDGAAPLPLRVEEVALERTEPDRVRAIAWADPEPGEREFAVEALVQAERDGSGPLADFLRDDIERNTDSSGYLGPDDPYLVQEKRAQFAMRLRHVRDDHDLRTWDDLVVNGRRLDPRLLYVPTGADTFDSLGHRVGCDMGAAPRSVRYRLPARNPTKAVPPAPFVADVTGQCYDGACPQPRWRAIQATELREAPRDGAVRIGALSPGEEVTPLRTEAHVAGSRAVATRDHDRFFESDVFYVLDSQAEGFFRVWHYGDVLVIDASDIDLGAGWTSCRAQDRCWARAEGPPQAVWWARVRRKDGSEGWVREPLDSLDGVLRSD